MTPLIDAERWCPIEGYEEHYEISDLGRVKSRPRSHLLFGRHAVPYYRSVKSKVLSPSKSGPYDTISLYKEGEPKGFSIHSLVARHFIDNPEKFPEVNHVDEDKKNNCYTNLEWTTSSDNSLHSSYKTTGSRNGLAKLTERDVLEIIKLISEGSTQTSIAKRFNVSPHCIFRIKAGDNWAWLTGFGKEDTCT